MFLQVHHKRWAKSSHERTWNGRWWYHCWNHIWSGYRQCELSPLLMSEACSVLQYHAFNTQFYWTLCRMIRSTMENSAQWWEVEPNRDWRFFSFYKWLFLLLHSAQLQHKPSQEAMSVCRSWNFPPRKLNMWRLSICICFHQSWV